MDSSEDDEIRFFNCVADFAVKKRDKDGSLEELQACFSISGLAKLSAKYFTKICISIYFPAICFKYNHFSMDLMDGVVWE
ncbi:hypothetical protein RHMOL_Rhmol02G0045900 [Rhododendron molle]|uniref:Uncharacterized protein n=1 Tax=Rhododendron molle TaxID=49168 RepID=A0ACC0PMW6_RHOML|nr:hypothetical protein RHMOL_Rhmol02G0045900 [Rhododendron molle]